ncbi:MFS transporter [Streptomyces sp. NPDC090106]|uniref:MFS transporter n=1 Tax=Streptomyces sp. NPDC090106 TaxID=3365946 RepID=UPI0038298B14
MTIDAHRAATDRPGDASSLAADIGARFERLPLSRWQVTVRLIIGTATFFEAFDQLLIAYALPQLRGEWNLDTGHTTALMTVGSVGMLIGALVSGRLADRVGRVKVIATCIAVASLCNLALTLCHSPEPFMAIRFLQGMAIGGEVPIAATFIAEITRAHRRGRFVLLFELVFPAGLTAGALVAYWLIPLLGWRWMFALAALPAVLCPVILRRVPESPRWLADHGHHEKALATMAAIEAKVEKSTGAPLPDPEPAHPAAPSQGRGGLGELLGRRYRKRMIVIGVLWFTGYFVNYGITSWLPTIYGTRFGLDLSTALLYSTVTSCAGLLGCLVVALTVDRVGRRNTVVRCLGAAALCLLVLGLAATGTAVGVLAWTSLAAVFLFGCNICLYVYTPELFPTRIRALGVSLGSAMNRLGIILGPIVVGAVYAGGAIGTVFVTLAAVALVGSVTAATGAEETSGRRLEDVAP